MAMSCKDVKQPVNIDNGKYVRYTPEQVEALERLYHECPKPSSIRRQQFIRECPILSNIESKQIKVWFQNRRCREKQRKEASRLQAVNRKLTAMNKLLMEENERLQKQFLDRSCSDAAVKGAMQTGKPVGVSKIGREAGESTASDFHPHLSLKTYLTCRFFSSRKHGLVDVAVGNNSAVIGLPVESVL